MGIAIITGASSGLGREFAIQLDRLPEKERPDEFVLIARREEELEKTASMLKTPARLLAWDLLDEENQRIFKNRLEEEKPEISYLVNSAGFGKIGGVSDLSLEVQRNMLRLNCELPLTLSYLVSPYLIEGAKVFQIASVAAFLPQPYFTIYAASKAFVLSFSRALAVEWKERGIQVIGLCPGPMETEFFQVAGSQEESSKIKNLGMEKVEDVTRTAIRRAFRAKDISLHSPMAHALRFVSRILPHPWILQIEAWLGIWAKN